MVARERLAALRERFPAASFRAEIPADTRLYLHVPRELLPAVCECVFSQQDARYVISIGADDRPYSGGYLVAHDFAYDEDHILCSIMTTVPEAVLARELGICYGTIAMVTNYAAGISPRPLTHQEVLEIMAKNTEKLRGLILSTLKETPKERFCDCGKGAGDLSELL